MNSGVSGKPQHLLHEITMIQMSQTKFKPEGIRCFLLCQMIFHSHSLLQLRVSRSRSLSRSPHLLFSLSSVLLSLSFSPSPPSFSPEPPGFYQTQQIASAYPKFHKKKCYFVLSPPLLLSSPCLVDFPWIFMWFVCVWVLLCLSEAHHSSNVSSDNGGRGHSREGRERGLGLC